MHEFEPKRTHFIINEASQLQVIAKAVRLAYALKATQGSITQMGEIPKDVQDLVFVGGDGTYNTALRYLLAHTDFRGNVFLVAGGSACGMFHDLKWAGVTVTGAQLLSGEIDPEKIPPFHPGMVNSGVFGHVAGWGPAAEEMGRWNEALRNILPRQLRAHAAALVLLWDIACRKEEEIPDPIMEWAFTGVCVGPKLAFPDHKLHGETMVFVTFPKKPFLSYALMLAAYPFLTKEAAAKIIKIEYKKEHTAPNTNPVGNLDGELFPLDPYKEVIIKRSDVGFNMIALALE